MSKLISLLLPLFLTSIQFELAGSLDLVASCKKSLYGMVSHLTHRFHDIPSAGNVLIVFNKDPSYLKCCIPCQYDKSISDFNLTCNSKWCIIQKKKKKVQKKKVQMTKMQAIMIVKAAIMDQIHISDRL